MTESRASRARTLSRQSRRASASARACRLLNRSPFSSARKPGAVHVRRYQLGFLSSALNIARQVAPDRTTSGANGSHVRREVDDSMSISRRFSRERIAFTV